MITSWDVKNAAANLDADELHAWMLRMIKEAVGPLTSLPTYELAAIADGKPPPVWADWLTPPMARLQIRLREILTEHDAP
jgi:hypothetical protein